MLKFSGSCLCGAVTYQGEAEPIFMGNCHCTDCRKVSGGGHASLMAVPEATVAFKGDIKEYEMTADSGATVTHHFCPKCGSQVYNKNTNPAMGGVATIVATTLDDPEIYKPAMAVYAKRALSWDQPPSDIPHFPELPQMET